jgi:hypothetical protein
MNCIAAAGGENFGIHNLTSIQILVERLSRSWQHTKIIIDVWLQCVVDDKVGRKLEISHAHGHDVDSTHGKSVDE